MTTTDILQHREGAVLTLTFNRTEKKNSITTAMYSAMSDMLQEAQADDGVKVVLYQGSESVYTAGNDIRDFLDHPPETLDAPVFTYLRTLAGFTKPLLAAVCGPAVGIGTTMLLHCDMVYAGDNAMFSMPFVNLGVCPEAGSSVLLPQLVGQQRASELLLTGGAIDADAAAEMGLVMRVLPPGEVNAFAQQQAQRLAGKPMRSLLETRRLLRARTRAQVLEAIEEEALTFARMLNEPPAQEALTAFVEKRKPDFSSY